MPKLGINIDHVATLRQARKGVFPSPLEAAMICQKSGADSIVAHLREDRRHIQEADLIRLKKNLKIGLNLEMALSKDIVDFALKLRPRQVTLVPEKRQELTTEGGLDAIGNAPKIKSALKKFNARRIAVSLFIDPDLKQISAAGDCGVKIIEIHTGSFAEAKTKNGIKKSLQKVLNAVIFAQGIGLTVNAGHGLDYVNVRRLAKIKGINELNIGYAIVCRALFTGLSAAVKQMKRLVK